MEQCRICILTCNSEFVSLVDDNSEDGLSCYGKAVLTFADVSISPKDKLPKAMCFNCVKLLKYAIHFKLTCEKNHKTLKALSKRSSANITPEINVVDTNIIINNIVDGCDTKIDDYNIKVDGCSKKYKRSNMENAGYSEMEKIDDVDTKIDDDDMIEDLGSCSDNDDVFELLESYYNQSLQESKYNVADVKVKDNKNITKPHRRKSNNIVRKRHRETEVEFEDMLNVMEDNLEAVMKAEEMDRNKNNRQIKSDPNINTTKPFMCNVCQKVLSSRSACQAHMQRHEGYHFICEHCGKGFASKYELRYHLFHMHKEGAYIQCEQCDFKAIKPFDMKEHRRIHSGERPFACEKCGLTFRRRYIWKGHMDHSHGEKKIKCPECPREFSRRGCLLEHSNSVHRRRYLYSCTQCDVTYAKIHTVRRHLADKHGITRERQGRYVPDGPTKRQCKKKGEERKIKCCGDPTQMEDDDCHYKPKKCCNEKKHFKFRVLSDPADYDEIAASCGYNCCACIKICTSLLVDELCSCLVCRSFSDNCRDKLCDLVDVLICCTRDCCVCCEKMFLCETKSETKRRKKRKKDEKKRKSKKEKGNKNVC